MKTLTNFDGYTAALTGLNDPERSLLPPVDSGGRVRVAAFSYESTAATTDGANIAAAIIPKGAVILQIHIAYEAFGTTAALDLGLFTLDGTAIDDDVFAAAKSIATAGTADYYPVDDTDSTSTFYRTSQDSVLTLTAETANWAADKYLKGFVLYAVNS